MSDEQKPVLNPDAAAEAPAKPARKRTPRAKPAATEVAAAPELTAEAPAEVPAAETAPKARAPRRRKPAVTAEVDAVLETGEAQAQPTPTPAAELAAQPAPEAAPPAQAREASEPREARGSREARGPREAREPREARGPREAREPREDREPREAREDREPREARDEPSAPSLVLQDEQVEAALSERLNALLAEGDAAPEPAPAELAPAEAEKRVLAAEADAPKLQKVLAQSGVGSRRDIEAWIAEGKIEVNGEPAHIGQRISWGDRVSVNGKPVKIRIQPPLPRVLAYHKPVGEIVTFNDPEGRPTVFRSLPRLQMGKWLSVGRLDINTEGLLLFTNSGDLANQLMHPRFGVEREYAVRVLGQLDDEAKARLLEGVEVDGQTAAFKSIESAGGEGANRWYRVVITEGRNREVRKLFDAVGLTVSRLIRVRYGSVVLPLGLKRGVWVELNGFDVKSIRRLAQPGGGEERRPDGGRGAPRADKGKGPRENPRGERPPRAEAPFAERPPRAEPRQRAEDDDDYMPRDINPLEQTFDRRFAKSKRGFPQGFGHGGSAPDHGQAPRGRGPGGEPDPMRTSVGYIGADSFHRRSGGGGGGGKGGGGGGKRRR
ncbi:23S rRNA pseudouridine(2605) synthase RluB [Inhella sp.]|uniref:23S rRNA pseudouridine(2605) synthase RluB n=1 Tax=Inhella sp. TaxID=1921806 RepID=UPI0035B3E023